MGRLGLQLELQLGRNLRRLGRQLELLLGRQLGCLGRQMGRQLEWQLRRLLGRLGRQLDLLLGRHLGFLGLALGLHQHLKPPLHLHQVADPLRDHHLALRFPTRSFQWHLVVGRSQLCTCSDSWAVYKPKNVALRSIVAQPVASEVFSEAEKEQGTVSCILKRSSIAELTKAVYGRTAEVVALDEDVDVIIHAVIQRGSRVTLSPSTLRSMSQILTCDEDFLLAKDTWRWLDSFPRRTVEVTLPGFYSRCPLSPEAMDSRVRESFGVLPPHATAWTNQPDGS